MSALLIAILFLSIVALVSAATTVPATCTFSGTQKSSAYDYGNAFGFRCQFPSKPKPGTATFNIVHMTSPSAFTTVASIPIPAAVITAVYGSSTLWEINAPTHVVGSAPFTTTTGVTAAMLAEFLLSVSGRRTIVISHVAFDATDSVVASSAPLVTFNAGIGIEKFANIAARTTPSSTTGVVNMIGDTSELRAGEIATIEYTMYAIPVYGGTTSTSPVITVYFNGYGGVVSSSTLVAQFVVPNVFTAIAGTTRAISTFKWTIGTNLPSCQTSNANWCAGRYIGIVVVNAAHSDLFATSGPRVASDFAGFTISGAETRVSVCTFSGVVKTSAYVWGNNFGFACTFPQQPDPHFTSLSILEMSSDSGYTVRSTIPIPHDAIALNGTTWIFDASTLDIGKSPFTADRLTSIQVRELMLLIGGRRSIVINHRAIASTDRIAATSVPMKTNPGATYPNNYPLIQAYAPATTSIPSVSTQTVITDAKTWSAVPMVMAMYSAPVFDGTTANSPTLTLYYGAFVPPGTNAQLIAQFAPPDEFSVTAGSNVVRLYFTWIIGEAIPGCYARDVNWCYGRYIGNTVVIGANRAYGSVATAKVNGASAGFVVNGLQYVTDTVTRTPTVTVLSRRNEYYRGSEPIRMLLRLYERPLDDTVRFHGGYNFSGPGVPLDETMVDHQIPFSRFTRVQLRFEIVYEFQFVWGPSTSALTRNGIPGVDVHRYLFLVPLYPLKMKITMRDYANNPVVSSLASTFTNGAVAAPYLAALGGSSNLAPVITIRSQNGVASTTYRAGDLVQIEVASIDRPYGGTAQGLLPNISYAYRLTNGAYIPLALYRHTTNTWNTTEGVQRVHFTQTWRVAVDLLPGCKILDSTTLCRGQFDGTIEVTAACVDGYGSNVVRTSTTSFAIAGLASITNDILRVTDGDSTGANPTVSVHLTHDTAGDVAGSTKLIFTSIEPYEFENGYVDSPLVLTYTLSLVSGTTHTLTFNPLSAVATSGGRVTAVSPTTIVNSERRYIVKFVYKHHENQNDIEVASVEGEYLGQELANVVLIDQVTSDAFIYAHSGWYDTANKANNYVSVVAAVYPDEVSNSNAARFVLTQGSTTVASFSLYAGATTMSLSPPGYVSSLTSLRGRSQAWAFVTGAIPSPLVDAYRFYIPQWNAATFAWVFGYAHGDVQVKTTYRDYHDHAEKSSAAIALSNRATFTGVPKLMSPMTGTGYGRLVPFVFYFGATQRTTGSDPPAPFPLFKFVGPTTSYYFRYTNTTGSNQARYIDVDVHRLTTSPLITAIGEFVKVPDGLYEVQMITRSAPDGSPIETQSAEGVLIDTGTDPATQVVTTNSVAPYVGRGATISVAFKIYETIASGTIRLIVCSTAICAPSDIVYSRFITGYTSQAATPGSGVIAVQATASWVAGVADGSATGVLATAVSPYSGTVYPYIVYRDAKFNNETIPLIATPLLLDTSKDSIAITHVVSDGSAVVSIRTTTAVVSAYVEYVGVAEGSSTYRFDVAVTTGVPIAVASTPIHFAIKTPLGSVWTSTPNSVNAGIYTLYFSTQRVVGGTPTVVSIPGVVVDPARTINITAPDANSTHTTSIPYSVSLAYPPTAHTVVLASMQQGGPTFTYTVTPVGIVGQRFSTALSTTNGPTDGVSTMVGVVPYGRYTLTTRVQFTSGGPFFTLARDGVTIDATTLVPTQTCVSSSGSNPLVLGTIVRCNFTIEEQPLVSSLMVTIRKVPSNTVVAHFKPFRVTDGSVTFDLGPTVGGGGVSSFEWTVGTSLPGYTDQDALDLTSYERGLVDETIKFSVAYQDSNSNPVATSTGTTFTFNALREVIPMTITPQNRIISSVTPLNLTFPAGSAPFSYAYVEFSNNANTFRYTFTGIQSIPVGVISFAPKFVETGGQFLSGSASIADGSYTVRVVTLGLGRNAEAVLNISGVVTVDTVTIIPVLNIHGTGAGIAYDLGETLSVGFAAVNVGEEGLTECTLEGSRHIQFWDVTETSIRLSANFSTISVQWVIGTTALPFCTGTSAYCLGAITEVLRVRIGYRDCLGNPVAYSAFHTVSIAGQRPSQDPVLSFPAPGTDIGGPQASFTLAYTLTSPKPGTIRLLFLRHQSEGGNVYLMQLAAEDAVQAVVPLNGRNQIPLSIITTRLADDVTIEDGTYDVQLCYQDNTGGKEACKTNSNIFVDTRAVAPTITILPSIESVITPSGNVVVNNQADGQLRLRIQTRDKTTAGRFIIGFVSAGQPTRNISIAIYVPLVDPVTVPISLAGGASGTYVHAASVAIPDGSYQLWIYYIDSRGNLATPTRIGTETIVVDTVTLPPLLGAPVVGQIIPIGAPMSIQFAMNSLEYYAGVDTITGGSAELRFQSSAATYTYGIARRSTGASVVVWYTNTELANNPIFKSGGQLPDGIYTVTLSTVDARGNPPATAISLNVDVRARGSTGEPVQMDTTTQTPLIEIDSTLDMYEHGDTLRLHYVIPETAALSTVVLTMQVGTTILATIQAPTSSQLTWVIGAPLSGATGNETHTTGIFSSTVVFKISYQDVWLNPVAFAFSPQVVISGAPQTEDELRPPIIGDVVFYEDENVYVIIITIPDGQVGQALIIDGSGAPFQLMQLDSTTYPLTMIPSGSNFIVGTSTQIVSPVDTDTSLTVTYHVGARTATATRVVAFPPRTPDTLTIQANSSIPAYVWYGLGGLGALALVVAAMVSPMVRMALLPWKWGEFRSEWTRRHGSTSSTSDTQHLMRGAERSDTYGSSSLSSRPPLPPLPPLA